MEVANALPAQVGAEVKQAAQAAFIRGLQICAMVSTVGAIALAALAGFALRHTKPAAAPAGGAAGEEAAASQANAPA